MKKSFERYKPAVHRHWLVFAAGVEWCAVGIGLIAVACYWLYPSTWPLRIAIAALGVALGVGMYLLAFCRLVRKNLKRIERKPEVVCLFAFQGKRVYFLIPVMMAMGYAIRHSSLPKEIAAAVYFTMGMALILGSSSYFRRFSTESAAE
ncbi:MAG: hypothetical protein M1398_00605 [Deltaproteobacteria bacterium]|jgi:FtsH-binding integral membrane protein|nr:hypothetical protein [Deltaproteobacteria bacterium]MDA8306574.1 hypothetical protein [Deltaproteobacteria bacterium]